VDTEPARQFFLQPQLNSHRRYEALRACILDEQSLADVADRFGYRLSSLKSMLCRFRAACSNGEPPPFFFQTAVDALPVNEVVTINMAPSGLRPPTSAC
jgi:hypothetical protein